MSKRQTIRKAFLIGMFFTFPVTIAWMSPAMPIIYGFGGIIVGATIMFLLHFFIALFFGRAYCGFVCPGGGVSECLMRINDKEVKNSKLRVGKYIVWAFLVIATVGSFIWAGGVSEVDFFAGLEGGWIFLHTPYRYAIYFGVLFGTLVFQLLLGKRSFCQCACWIAPFMIIGTNVSDWLRLPRLRLKANQDSCNGCNLCSKKCPMSLDVKSMVKTSDMKNAECILCGECIDICPKKAISYTFKNEST
ncbi:MAG: 4Fe-4S binding protein [Defluviitaleaceae bacterium]|nr:4Fe-4S binding protein [Defluviitaleaceae bacterium]MCL2263589.1 4Fe-4S binding protein [Defluviitaleaceae bacterium]